MCRDEHGKINESCKDGDCKPQGTEIDPNIKQENTTRLTPGGDTHGPASEKSSTDSDHFNIFLAIGIAAAVIVAALLLAVLLYKFRRRDEGVYRVDESQNFAYLEAKKQQTNGSSATNVSNGKAGNKKRDVKEWYV